MKRLKYNIHSLQDSIRDWVAITQILYYLGCRVLISHDDYPSLFENEKKRSKSSRLQALDIYI